MPSHSRALEFSLVSECSPTITTSHKQWGLLIGGVEKESGRCWPVQLVLLAAGLTNSPKGLKVEATSRTVKDLRETLKMHHLCRTINTCFSSFLIYLSSKRTLMDQTLIRGCWSMSGNHKSTGEKKIVVLEFPAFTASMDS